MSTTFDCIGLELHVMGCPLACKHCKDMGHPPFGRLMTLEDVDSVLRQFESLGCKLTVLPYHEFTVYPEGPALMKRCGEIYPDALTDVLATNGHGIARRDDYQSLLQELADLGVKTFSYTTHGLPDRHDWFVGRPGAFQDIMTADDRADQAGFTSSFNIFLDRRNINDFLPLLDLLRKRKSLQYPDSIWICLPAYIPNDRLRKYEKTLRPTLSDLKPIEEPLRKFWDLPLDQYTEAAWTKKILADPLDPALNLIPPLDTSRQTLSLIVDANFDLYERGEFTFEWPPIKHGNLKAEPLETLLDRIRQWQPPKIPDTSTLAKTYGNPDSQLIHKYATSVHLKWIDLHLQRQK